MMQGASYPDGVRAGDPLAPWNMSYEPSRVCADCDRLRTMGENDKACILNAFGSMKRYVMQPIAEKLASCVVDGCGWCSAYDRLADYGDDATDCSEFVEA